jgi:hypothetical protein
MEDNMDKIIIAAIQFCCVIAAGYFLGDTWQHSVGIGATIWALMPVIKR